MARDAVIHAYNIWWYLWVSADIKNLRPNQHLSCLLIFPQAVTQLTMMARQVVAVLVTCLPDWILTPNETTPCPALPCYTFSHYLKNTTHHFTYNTKVTFLHGLIGLTNQFSTIIEFDGETFINSYQGYPIVPLQFEKTSSVTVLLLHINCTFL